MSDKSQNGCPNVRVWSYIVGSLYAVIAFLLIILLSATMVIYHKQDILEDNSEGSLSRTSITRYIVALLAATWSFLSAILMLRGLSVKPNHFILPFVSWNGLIILVSIIAAFIQFINDLLQKQTFATAMSTFALQFFLAAILFFMMIPFVLHYNNLKARPYSAQLEGD